MTKDEMSAALKAAERRASKLDADLNKCREELQAATHKLSATESQLEQTLAQHEHHDAITKQALRLNIVLSGGLLRDP